MTLLVVKNLSKNATHKKRFFSYSQKQAVSPLDFELNQGETLAIVGENGSGKSTVANMLAGIEKPTTGNIFLNGQKLQDENFRQRCQHIRMIFQHGRQSLSPTMTIGKTLHEPLKLNTQLTFEQQQSKIIETCRKVGLLSDHYHFYPHMLSDGQIQRVALARALILDPQVIVADEPLASLDPSVKSQMVNLFLELQSSLGIAFVFVSHNMGIVRHISDRVLVLKNGEMVEQGTTEQIFNAPKEPYTKEITKYYRHKKS